MLQVKIQTSPGFAKGLADGMPKFIEQNGICGYAASSDVGSMVQLSGCLSFQPKSCTASAQLYKLCHGCAHHTVQILHVCYTWPKSLLYWYPCSLRHAIPTLEPTPLFSRIPLHMCFLSVRPPSPPLPPQTPLRTAPPPTPPLCTYAPLPCSITTTHLHRSG